MPPQPWSGCSAAAKVQRWDVVLLMKPRGLNGSDALKKTSLFSGGINQNSWSAWEKKKKKDWWADFNWLLKCNYKLLPSPAGIRVLTCLQTEKQQLFFTLLMKKKTIDWKQKKATLVAYFFKTKCVCVCVLLAFFKTTVCLLNCADRLSSNIFVKGKTNKSILFSSGFLRYNKSLWCCFTPKPHQTFKNTVNDRTVASIYY